MWLITIVSKRNLTEENKDFIAELISEEARKAKDFYSFILHDILESKRLSEIIIEGTKTALVNLLSVMKDNLNYKITYTKI
ncbi:MAG: hypothetical protein HY883_03740 [Deltaproteobacteria bacterium]|nr:hypothetical protein [Deltaproteobacteria bacterium]